MTIVIAISGPPGSGKSTLCSLLCHHFETSIYISMDDFQLMTDWDPITLHRWFHRGADYNQLPMPRLVEYLQAAITAQNHLVNDTESLHRFVFLESHLGSATDALADLVNYVVWIDCGLDICLARALIAMTTQNASPKSAEISGCHDITHYLEQYIALTSKLLRLQNKRIRPCADYIYDGSDIEALICWIISKRTPFATS
jgi:uridine kinase